MRVHNWWRNFHFWVNKPSVQVEVCALVLGHVLLRVLHVWVSINDKAILSSSCRVLWSVKLRSMEPIILLFSCLYVMGVLFMFTGFLLRRQREEGEERWGGGGGEKWNVKETRERWGELGELVRERKRRSSLRCRPLSKKRTKKPWEMMMCNGKEATYG